MSRKSKGTAILAIVAVVLMAMFLSGCGEMKDILDAFKMGGRAEVREAAEYPGEIAKTVIWESEVNVSDSKVTYRGVVETEMTVWYPMKLEEVYAHPYDADADYEIKSSIQDRDVWVIPFVYTLTNMTEGPGQAIFPGLVGIADAQHPGGYLYAPEIGNYTNEDMLEYPNFYFWTVSFAGQGRKNEGLNYSSLTFALSEGESRTVYGYTLFVDQEQTPDKPNGVGSIGQKYIFGGGAKGEAPAWFMTKPLFMLQKDDAGNLVFDREYD